MNSSNSPHKFLHNASFGSHFEPSTSLQEEYDDGVGIPKNITPQSSAQESRRKKVEAKKKKKSKSKKRKKKARNDIDPRETNSFQLDAHEAHTIVANTCDTDSRPCNLLPKGSSQLQHYSPTEIPTQDYEPLSQPKKKKKIKSKRHRKRHLLPGPAGALQLASDTTLFAKSKSNSNVIENEVQELTSTSQDPSKREKNTHLQRQGKHSSTSSSIEPIPTIVGTIIHLQDHPAWKSMCVALSRYTPHFSQIYHHHFNNSYNCSVTTLLSAYVHKSLDNEEYATIFEILAGKHDCIVHPHLVVYISNLFLHSHCDYTCELMDESGLSIKGWLNERFVKERQQEGVIRIGTVLLLKETAITIFRRNEEDNNNMELGFGFVNELGKNQVNGSTIELGETSNTDATSSVTNATSLERMLLIGEDTVVCWWKASDATNITYDEESTLMKERNIIANTVILILIKIIDFRVI